MYFCQNVVVKGTLCMALMNEVEEVDVANYKQNQLFANSQ